MKHPIRGELEILTTKEVGDWLQAYPGSISEMARRGEIPGFKIGADWRFIRSEIERWMRGQEHKP